MIFAYPNRVSNGAQSYINRYQKKYPNTRHLLDCTYVVLTISLDGGEACAFLQILILIKYSKKYLSVKYYIFGTDKKPR